MAPQSDELKQSWFVVIMTTVLVAFSYRKWIPTLDHLLAKYRVGRGDKSWQVNATALAALPQWKLPSSQVSYNDASSEEGRCWSKQTISAL